MHTFYICNKTGNQSTMGETVLNVNKQNLWSTKFTVASHYASFIV